MKSTVQEGFARICSAVQSACQQAAQQQGPQQHQQATYAPPIILQSNPQEQDQRQNTTIMPATPPAQPVQQPPPPHFIIQVTCQQISAIPDPSSGGFSHPGTLMSLKELTLLQQRAAGAVAAPPPFQAALDALKAATPAQYSPHALRDILVEWDKNGVPGKKIGTSQK